MPWPGCRSELSGIQDAKPEIKDEAVDDVRPIAPPGSTKSGARSCPPDTWPATANASLPDRVVSRHKLKEGKIKPTWQM